MRANVDVRQALDLLAKLEPELVAHASTFAAHTPWRGDGDTLDRALQAGLARLHVEVGHATFVYLRWHAERAHAATAAACAAGGTSETGRAVSDANGRRWTVWEVVPNDLFGGASPRWLVFHSSAERRRTTDYPPDWCARSDQELCTLLTRANVASDARPEVPRAR
jgi:hypothetical protein